jgi:hypothetical protein
MKFHTERQPLSEIALILRAVERRNSGDVNTNRPVINISNVGFPLFHLQTTDFSCDCRPSRHRDFDKENKPIEKRMRVSVITGPRNSGRLSIEPEN